MEPSQTEWVDMLGLRQDNEINGITHENGRWLPMATSFASNQRTLDDLTQLPTGLANVRRADPVEICCCRGLKGGETTMPWSHPIGHRVKSLGLGRKNGHIFL